MRPISQQQAVDEAVRKAKYQPTTPREILFLRAKAEFDMLDRLSRSRVLTNEESIRLERAINRMDDWEAQL